MGIQMIYFIFLLFSILLSFLITKITDSVSAGIFGRFFILAVLLVYFRKHFKFKLKFDFLAILVGILIAIEWIGLEFVFPVILKEVVPLAGLVLVVRLISFSVITPIIEEFFTRFYLIRRIISEKWKKVKLGSFSWESFIVTVLFFGFAHQRWFAGLISGVLFNLLYYKRKDIGSLVLAHGVANLAIGVYAIYTGNWQLI